MTVPAGSTSVVDVLVLRELDARQLKRQVDRVVGQLRTGDFRSAEVKKLKNAGVYRARLDDKNRLLFKMGDHRGRRVLLVLEVVHNHDYAKARFLGGGACGEDDFEPVTAPMPEWSASDRLAYVHPTSPTLHVLDKPLSFDDAQATVFTTPLPLIVIGSAGSGKTALTLEKLKTLPGHGLYLTRSSFLVENARALYFANGYANDGQDIDFLSLTELVETIDVPSGREATWADFAAWFGRMRGAFTLREPHRVYEEIKGVITGAAADDPYLSEADYRALGVRQSIFLGDQRAAVYQVFERWRDHLKASGLFDANIAAWERRAKAEEQYDFLVIDEVQDITNVELRLALATLRDKRNFLLCGDSNQIVHPNLFSWSKVKSLFHQEAGHGESPLDRIHILSANYRNTRAVTELANRLLLIKQNRFGSIDKESNYLVESVSSEVGRVDLVADTAAVRQEIDKKTRRSTRYAVIVLRDEDKPAARAVFTTPLVFSVQESKGLEYENVILFNLVSSAPKEFRECTAGVNAADLEGELVYARARDKTDKSLDAYKFYVNSLYVAMTRAIKSLLVVESEAWHPLFELLAVHRHNERVELAQDDSSREDWQREARRLELQGKKEQADQIRKEILEYQPVPWPVFDAASFPAIKAKAIGPGPHEKAAQQQLFEYALTYDAPGLIPELAAAGFRHATKPESGREYIEKTHHVEYRYKRSQTLQTQLRKHGVDFRNPLNQTPLMVAARCGRPDLVAELLAAGADPDLRDTAGRTALRVLLKSWSDKEEVKPAAWEETFRQLATRPIKVKVGARMAKLDPRTMEWFLLNFCLVRYRTMVANPATHNGLPVFNAPTLATWVSTFPSGVVPVHRTKRPYVSAMLSKNEASGTSPYNRRIFCRVGHGSYVLNPILEVDASGTWVNVADLMELTLLLDTVGRGGDYVKLWTQRLRVQLSRVFGVAAPPAPASTSPQAASETPR